MHKVTPLIDDDPHQECRALGSILDRIGKKWTVMVVGLLAQGPMRFNAIQRHVDGVSHRMLTLTLRGLERDGMVSRTVHPTVPPQTEYALTALGLSLVEPLKRLSEWAETHKPAVEKARGTYDDQG